MKKHLLILATLCMALCLAFTAFAAPTASGADDYASLSADGTLDYAPESEITAAQMMAAAVRLHSTLNNGGLTETYDLDTYYAYATSKGIFADGVYTSEDQIPTRAQVVTALYNAVNGKIDLTAINEVLDMIDVDPNAEYYEAALSFMKAGIITGYDDYGSFKPSNTVKRYELGLMIDRLLNPSERVTKKYTVYSSAEPFYLMDDFLLNLGAHGTYTGGSGWRIDYTGSQEIGTINNYANILRDYAADDDMSTSRRIHTQTDGELVFETVYEFIAGDTIHFGFYDADGKQIAVTGWQNGKAYVGTQTSSVALADKKEPAKNPDVNGFNYYMAYKTRTRVVLDLDEGKYQVWMGNSYIGEAPLSGTNLAKVKIYTGLEEASSVELNNTHLYKNYRVNDVFRLEMQGEAPVGYDVSGNVTVERITSNADNTGDVNSMKMVTAAGSTTSAKRSFEKATGKVIMEAYVLLEDGDTATTVENNAYFTVKSSDAEVITVKTNGNAWYANNTLIKDGVVSNVWQWIRIEADTNTQKALIKINGKVVNENVPFLVKADGFDGLEVGVVGATDEDVIWFDDIEVYETFDYDDYCPEPVPLDTGDYILNMSSCNLWRNGSHYGWDWIRPHAEVEPVLGYFDEGIPEEMDWEIKYLTEHGIQNYMACWYPLSNNVPLKKPRMSDAIHDGYFNAKYSDMMTFSLMYENSGCITTSHKTDFMNYIFPFWMEWYFNDDRYFKITEDGKDYVLLTIYQAYNFMDMCCEDYDLLYYNDYGDIAVKPEYVLPLSGTTVTPNDAFKQAYADSQTMIDWMEQQIVDAGIADGLIVCFGGGANTEQAYYSMAQAGGDGVILYAWGKNAWNVEAQENLATTHTARAKAQGIDLLTLATPGFNDIGWANERPGYMTTDNFETVLAWHKSQMATNFGSNADSWKSKLITFDTWNEFGEGHYLFPTAGEYKNEGYGGFGYLDAIAEVFGGVTRGSDAAEANNTVPTEVQKARVGHMYPNDNDHYIRRDLLEETEISNSLVKVGGYSSFTSTSVVTTSSGFGSYTKTTPTDTCQLAEKTGLFDSNKHTHCTFDANGNCTKSENTSIFAGSNYHNHGCQFYTTQNITQDSLQYNSSKGCLYGQITGSGLMQFAGTEITKGINMDEVSYIHMKLGTSTGGGTGKIYFKNTTDTSEYSGYAESRTFIFNTYVDGLEECDYYIDVTGHDLWTGTLAGIRVDVYDTAGEAVYLYALEFLTEDESTKKPTITVDNLSYVCKDYAEIREFDRNEIYIAPTEEGGLYKLLHIVYEWNRSTNILKLDTPDGTTFQFTVGSKTALVNGKSVTLDKAFYLYDGAPVIPLIYILDKAGYVYSYDFTNKKLNITVANTFEIVDDIENGNAEGANTTEFVSGSSLYAVTVETDPKDSSNKVWQVNTPASNTWAYIRTPFVWEAGKTYIIDFDARRTGLLGDGSDHPTDSSTLVFNARYADTAGTNGVEHNTSTERPAITDEWQHFTLTYTVADTVDTSVDTSTHQLSFYVDPYNSIGVPYQMDNIVVRTLPIPFKLVNGDAESTETGAAQGSFFSGNDANPLTIETESSDNHYWQLTNTQVNNGNYSYICQETSYEKGVTYYYKVRAKVGQNANTEDVSNARITLNARYYDAAKVGAAGEWYAHTQDLMDKDGSTIYFSTGGDWQQCYGSFTISQGHDHDNHGTNAKEEITFFVAPYNNSGVTFMIDDFEVTTDPAVYESWKS